MNQVFWPISDCIESFLIAHEAIHDKFWIEMKSNLEKCFLITIEIFDDIIKNFKSILVYTNIIDESFVSMKEVWGIFWILRAMNDAINDSNIEKLCQTRECREQLDLDCNHVRSNIISRKMNFIHDDDCVNLTIRRFSKQFRKITKIKNAFDNRSNNLMSYIYKTEYLHPLSWFDTNMNAETRRTSEISKKQFADKRKKSIVWGFEELLTCW